MDQATFATEQLKTIRTLMERATIYRVVVGETAMVAGTVAIVLGGAAMQMAENWNRSGPVAFAAMWMALLVVVAIVNGLLLHKQAKMRSEPFFSNGMKIALRSVAPPLLTGFVVGLVGLVRNDSYQSVVEMWTIFYGLALLATGTFSPRSMQWLGAGFLVFGLLLVLVPNEAARTSADYRIANAAMSVGFGGLHAAYGLAVMAKQAKDRQKNAVN